MIKWYKDKLKSEEDKIMFGEYLRRKRLEKNISARTFAKFYDLISEDIYKIENNYKKADQKELDAYADLFEYKKNTEVWDYFMNRAREDMTIPVHKDKKDLLFEAIRLVNDATQKDIDAGRDAGGTIICPKCQNQLLYMRSGLNGHSRGKCVIDDCISWII
jgi:transcriptional regulator with XRE-family HTH domain